MLIDKFETIIVTLKDGHVIESTRGLAKCNGIHLTKKDMLFLIQNQLIKRTKFVGKHSSEYIITEKCAELELTNK